MIEENRSSNEIIGVAIEVHTAQVSTYLKLSEKSLVCYLISMLELWEKELKGVYANRKNNLVQLCVSFASFANFR